MKKLTVYDPEPYEVIERKGSMVKAKRGSKHVTRDSSYFKRFEGSGNESQEPEIDELTPPLPMSSVSSHDSERKEPPCTEVAGSGSEIDKLEKTEAVDPNTLTYPKRVRRPPDRYSPI